MADPHDYNQSRLSQRLVVLEERLTTLRQDFSRYQEEQKEKEREERVGYVSRIEFEPVKKIIYALVGLVLTSVILGVITLLFKVPP